MPEEFIRRLPPYKANLSTETVARIIEMREVEKKSFVIIGNELRITTEKAKHAYDWFYHQQVLALTREMSNKAETEKEKTEIWDHYFRSTTSSKSVMKC